MCDMNREIDETEESVEGDVPPATTSGGNGHEKLLTQKQVAAKFQVCASTVSEWVRSGKLRSVTLPSGRTRIRASDVEQILGRAEEAARS